MRQKTYGPTDYGTLVSMMLSDTNAISPSGASVGSIASGAVQTTQSVANKDFLLDRVKTFLSNQNYDWDIDVNRNLNFYLAKGSNKSCYSLTYGGDADNITVAPELTEDVMNMANSVYGETSSSGLSNLAQDATSQDMYGLFEGVLSGGSASSQSDLNTQVSAQLGKTAYPTRGFTITANDSTLCPFNDIFVGDSVTVNLISYFNYTALMRILRMIHDEKTNTRQITVGEVIYKPLAPTKRMYQIT